MTSSEFEGMTGFDPDGDISNQELSAEDQKAIADHLKDEKETLILTAAAIGLALLTGYGIKKYRNRDK